MILKEIVLIPLYPEIKLSCSFPSFVTEVESLSQHRMHGKSF